MKVCIHRVTVERPELSLHERYMQSLIGLIEIGADPRKALDLAYLQGKMDGVRELPK